MCFPVTSHYFGKISKVIPALLGTLIYLYFIYTEHIQTKMNYRVKLKKKQKKTNWKHSQPYQIHIKWQFMSHFCCTKQNNLSGRWYRLIRVLLLRSIFPNQSFTELSITACKSYPVLFHLYIMTFSHTCTHIQTHTWMCLMGLSTAVDTIHHFKSSTKGGSSGWLVLSGAPRPQCTPSRLLCSRRN